MKPKIVTKLKKGDLVEIIAGGEKGRSGRILRFDPIKSRVYIEGCNLVKKTKKRRSESEESEIIEIEAPIHISNVMYLSEKGKSRLGIKVDGKNKSRVAKNFGEVIDG